MKITKCERKGTFKYPLNPKFGTVFVPYMLKMHVELDQKPDTLQAEIRPFEKESYSAGVATLHYGQSVFEGLKVFRQKDGSVAAFRADLHAKRFMKSCVRMAIPTISEEVFLECLREFMHFDESYVPSEPDHSLYIRPIQFAADEMIKVGRSRTYNFYILGTIAGSYFPGGQARPAKVFVGKQFVRAFPGGLGEVKTAANYAASLGPQTHAEKYQCDQVLYLDGLHHDHIDELGGMNLFIVRKGELVTPTLNGCILPGVTRRSILDLAPEMGIKAREETISFSKLEKEIQAGDVTEVFACGTAAVVHPIGEFTYQEKMDGDVRVIKVGTENPVASKVLQTIKAAQRGEIKTPAGWLFK